MKKSFRIIAMTATLLGFMTSFACAEEVMGRCVAYDKTKNTISIIKDFNNNKANPDFQLPLLTYSLPEGTTAKEGKRIKLDLNENKLKYYDDTTNSLKTIDFKLVEKKENIQPLDRIVVGEKFPAIDKAKKTVTIYSKRQKVLTVISVDDNALSLPEKIYDSGDDIKVTVGEPGKAVKIEK